MNGAPRARQLVEHRLVDLFDELLDLAPIERRHRRESAHPAGVRSGVAVADALVVARGGERQRTAPVAEREHRQLLPFEQLLDHDAVRRARRRPRSPASSSSWSRQTNTPFPAASPSALTTHGGRATGSAAAAGTPAAASTSFAKLFEPSIRAAAAVGPNVGDAGVAQLVRDARDERRLRSDHREVDLERAVPAEQPLAVVRPNRVARPERGDAGIPGRRVQLLEQRALAQLPGQRVLASPRADDQHPHAPESCKPLGVFEPAPGGRPRARAGYASPMALGDSTSEAPPYSTAPADVVRAPGRRRGAGRAGRRGAARDPDQRRADRGDDAHARARRGARARVLPVRGPAPGRRAPRRTTSPPTSSRSTRPGSTRRGCSAASTPLLPAASAGKARSKQLRSMRRASRAASSSPRTSSPDCPTDSARRSLPSPPPAGCTRPASSTPAGELLCPPRGRRPPQRLRQGRRLGIRRGPPSARREPDLRQRPPLVRARPEGGRCRLPDPRRRRRSVEPRRPAGRRPRDHPLRLRARRPRQRLHGAVADRALTGVLLVGGASTRFGSPKALAEHRRADARRARLGDARVLRRADRSRQSRRTASSSRSRCSTTAPTPARPIAGVVAALRAAANDLYGDPPGRHAAHRRGTLEQLADACADAAVPQTGPLPGAYRRTALPVLERHLAAGELSLRAALERARHSSCQNRPGRARQREHAR